MEYFSFIDRIWGGKVHGVSQIGGDGRIIAAVTVPSREINGRRPAVIYLHTREAYGLGMPGDIVLPGCSVFEGQCSGGARRVPGLLHRSTEQVKSVLSNILTSELAVRLPKKFAGERGR